MAGDPTLFPENLDILIEKKFAFKVDVTIYNLKEKVPIYGISKITDDYNIMAELDKKLSTEQVLESNSLNVTMIDFQSEETITFKDVVSYTGDNVTPVSNTDKNTGTSPLVHDRNSTVVSTRKSLKRKLDDDYDIDDITTMSATKFSGRSIPNEKGGAKGDDNKKLLIPKIEKS
ncbi:hypothetical protein L1987_13951 [Smallanthus sonchifolius]|uniref:Uncharacterized protein n=1 Tax=Smallanthus sonchifolius TaxID=185202 RepID=A0ACB9JJI2_9ASTR|nr:hypothetical protein L1987_13951 [Smallanthus sonchifolius]